MTKEKDLEGIGGWLIIVAVSIIISPIRLIVMGFTTFLPIFSNGTWAAVTTPGTNVYNPLWSSILLGEISINCGLILVWLYLGFLFFTKKKVFPKWYIGVMLFSLIFVVIDAIAIKAVLPNNPIFNPETFKEFIRALVATIIWVPYMVISKRVKATFIK